MYTLVGKLPFSIWAQQHAVAFLLRAVASPCDTLLHQSLVQLLELHAAGNRNWLSTVTDWIRQWDHRFGLRLHATGQGFKAVCFVWSPWDEYAPQRQWKFPGIWGRAPQFWLTTEFAREGGWREEWKNLVSWGKRVSQRYASRASSERCTSCRYSVA